MVSPGPELWRCCLPGISFAQVFRPLACLWASPSGTLQFVDAGSYTQTPAQKAAYTAFGKRYKKVKLTVDELSSTLTTWDAHCRTRICLGVQTDLLMLNGQFVAAFARRQFGLPPLRFPGLVECIARGEHAGCERGSVRGCAIRAPTCR